MNKTKYNQLRKAIISAVPEIVELKQPEFSNYIGLCEKVFGRNKNGDINFPEYGSQAEDIFNKMEVGRDILLEDCLIALNRDRPLTKSGYIDAIDSSGEFITICGNDEPWARQPQAKWQLGKPLQDQSNETKDLLWDLICKDG